MKWNVLRPLNICLIAILLAGVSPTVFAQYDPPSGYYDSANGLTGSALRSALHNIIDDHNDYPYTSSSTDTWDILSDADEDPGDSGYVITIYYNNSMVETSSSGPWNREHSWPSSYALDGTDAYTDCHHLRASYPNYNSSRGNKYFDWSSGSSYAVLNSSYNNYADSDSWQVWEGRRGDIARSMFYMDVRYEGDSGDPDLVLTDNTSMIDTGSPYMGKLSTLIEWHEEDPVDEKERRRNHVVYGYQNNRNPFVDHPEYVALIFGDYSPPSPNTYDFGTVNAANGPFSNSSLVVEAVNNGVSINYDSATGDTSVLSYTGPSSFNLNSGDTQNLAFSFDPPSNNGQSYSATFTFTSSDTPNSFQVVVYGSVMDNDYTVSGSSVNFGEKVAQSGPYTDNSIQLEATGGAVTVNFESGLSTGDTDVFSYTGDSAISLNLGETYSLPFEYDPQTNETASYSATFHFSSTSSPNAFTVTLSGSTVAADDYSVSQTSVDFGTVDVWDGPFLNRDVVIHGNTSPTVALHYVGRTGDDVFVYEGGTVLTVADGADGAVPIRFSPPENNGDSYAATLHFRSLNSPETLDVALQGTTEEDAYLVNPPRPDFGVLPVAHCPQVADLVTITAYEDNTGFSLVATEGDTEVITYEGDTEFTLHTDYTRDLTFAFNPPSAAGADYLTSFTFDVSNPEETFTIVVTGSTAREASPVYYEPFNYPAGDLWGSHSPWSEIYSQGDNPIQVLAGSLPQTGLPPLPGNRVQLNGFDPGEDLKLDWDGGFQESDVAVSFLFRASQAPEPGNQDLFFALNREPESGEATDFACFYVKQGGASDRVQLGLSLETGAAAPSWSGDLMVNATYRLVAVYKIENDPTRDSLTLYVQPTPESALEGEGAAMTVSHAGGAGENDLGSMDRINGFRLHQQDNSGNWSIELDEIRIAEEYSDVNQGFYQDYAPQFLSLVRTGGDGLTSSTRLPYEMRFSEAVTGVAAGDFAATILNGDTEPAPSIAVSLGPNGATWLVEILSPDAEREIRLDVPAGATFQDYNGNEITGWPYTAAAAYHIDTKAPELILVNPENQGSVSESFDTVELRFTEPIKGLDATDFSIDGETFSGTLREEGGHYFLESFRLAPALSYTFNLPADTLRDSIGNPFAGTDWTYHFHTDYTAGTEEWSIYD